MKITLLQIDNLRNIRHLEIREAPSLLLLAGANGCGKSTILDAILLAKEAIGAYHSVQFDPRQITVGADFAEVSLELDTTEEECAFVATQANQELPTPARCTVRLLRNGKAQVMDQSTGLSQLFRTYRRRDYPDVGVFVSRLS